MTNFVKKPGNIVIEMRVNKLEKLMEKETDSLKRDMYLKIIERTIRELEACGS